MVQAPDLTHALLETGVCKSGDLDEAQARQLIFGGSLELNLLETGVVQEADLLRALGAVVLRGVDVAQRAEAIALPGPIPAEHHLSARIRTVVREAVGGYSEAGSIVVSLVDRPTEDAFVALAQACGGREVTFQYTTTLRLLEALALLDGLLLGRRVEEQLVRTGRTLGRLQEAPPEIPPLTASLRVEPDVVPIPAVPPPIAGPAPTDSSLSELGRLVNQEGAGGTAAIAVPPYVAVGAAATPAPLHHAADETAPPPAGYQELARSVIPPPPEPLRSPAEEPRAPMIEPAYSQRQALQDLATARDRDTIVSTVCRFCAQFFEYVAVFGIQASEARGLTASGPGKSAERIADLRVPLDVPSALSRVKDTGQHRVARLRASGLEGGLVRDLERPLGPAVLLLPIAVQSRTLLLVWADDGPDDVDIEHALPALALVRPAGAALERVLIERKRASRLARPSLVPGVVSKPEVTEAPAPTFESRPTRLGMSMPPAGTRMSSAPAPALPPEPQPEAQPAAQSDAPRPSTSTPPVTPETPRKKKLSESFADGDVTGSDAPAVRSDPPLAFPSNHPKTMKGFPADLRLKPSQSPAPKVSAPLLSRRIVAVSEQARAERDPPEQVAFAELPAERRFASGESPSGGTMLSPRAELDSPPPRTSDRPPKRPSSAPLSYRALVTRWLDGDEGALSRLLEGGESAVGALIAAFPGPVREPESPQAPASECGPVLQAIAKIGPKATPFLTVRTADEDSAVRRWAVYLLGELPGRDAARAIADRLLDETVDVRRAALASARRIQGDALTRRTLRARLEEMTRDTQLLTEERCAAVEAIADIREHESIPTLLQLLEDDSPVVKRAARWALSVLTRHDFQEDAEKWREFWQRHRNEPRSEWLLLALKNAKGDLARAAADEIESVVGSPIGDIEHLTDDTIAHLRDKLRRPGI